MPDGAEIAFTSVRGSENIYVMSEDGTAVRRLTRGGATDPTWQPQRP